MALRPLTKRKAYTCLIVIGVIVVIMLLSKERSRRTVYFPQKPLEIGSPPTENYLIKYPNNFWKPEKVKKILQWTPFFGSLDWAESARKSLQTCNNPYNQCVVTTNRSEVEDSSALIFHAGDYISSELPKYRHPRQVWILLTHEATPSMTGTFQNHTFNWTITYRRDSTIVIPYGGPYVRKTDEELRSVGKTGVDYFSEKSKFAVIHVSNCRDTARRYRIIHELSTHVEVDEYGHCPGKVICEQTAEAYKICLKYLKPYKFYLAFENSYCRDYITEKYWQSQLDRHQIPVVAYSNVTIKLLPPHSYINIFDFPSLKAVADKMIEVGSNKTLYNSYFEWQKLYKHVEKPSTPCEICKGLHENRTAQSYDLEAWMKHDSCALPTRSQLLVKSLNLALIHSLTRKYICKLGYNTFVGIRIKAYADFINTTVDCS